MGPVQTMERLTCLNLVNKTLMGEKTGNSVAVLKVCLYLIQSCNHGIAYILNGEIMSVDTYCVQLF